MLQRVDGGGGYLLFFFAGADQMKYSFFNLVHNLDASQLIRRLFEDTMT